MKPRTKIIVGIMTSVLTIGFILVYDFYIKERINTTEVVVVKAGETIRKSEQITEDKLMIERREKDSLVDGIIKADEMDSIIGYDAAQDIYGNSMLSKKMVDHDRMVPDPKIGEAIRPITQDMIYAKPGSLRRKDVVDIYLIYGDGTTSMEQNGPSTVSSQDTSQKEEEQTNSDETKTSTSQQKTDINREPFLKNVRVVYVKDSSNKEVVSPSDSESKDKRLNATSVISDLEVILSEEDFAKLMGEVLGKGAKLYITYQ